MFKYNLGFKEILVLVIKSFAITAIIIAVVLIPLSQSITSASPVITPSPTATVDNMTPFWASTTTLNESVLMVKDGNGLAQGTLLFAPISIISVKNAALNITYTEGVDWEYKDGKLRLLPGSTAPFFTTKELYPTKPEPGFFKDKVGGGYVLYRTGNYITNRQLAVTYTHAPNAWRGPIPVYRGYELPNTFEKLNNSVHLNVILYGDSISAGETSSEYISTPPFMPSWGKLFVDSLRAYYGSTISFINPSVSGKTSLWGAENVNTLVTPKHPDLCIIAFGMNDTSPVEEYRKNIESIMNSIRAKNPNCEFILVAPMLANPETFYAHQQENYLTALKALEGTGSVVADMTSIHQALLKRKPYVDFTSNNIGHPNDFLIRWYAQLITRLLIDDGPSDVCNIIGSNTLKNIRITTTSIFAYVDKNTSSVVMDFIPTKHAQLMLYSDAFCLKELTDKLLKLDYGLNVASLRVTAENGISSKSYLIVIYKEIPPPEIKIISVSPTKFIANGTNKLTIKGKLTVTPDYNCEVKAVIKNTRSQIVAIIPLSNQAGGDKLFSWNGRATTGNTAGLKAGTLVPVSKTGMQYLVWLVAKDTEGNNAISNGLTLRGYSR